MIKKRTVTKYWLTLVLWLAFPVVLEKFCDLQISFIGLVFGFALPYSIFAIASYVYEGSIVTCYLKKHYPYVAKKRNNLFGSSDYFGFDFILTFSPPNDDKWKSLQSYFKKFYIFPFVSIGMIFFFLIVYSVVWAVD